MSWRRAKSLVVLGNEIEHVAPGTTVWDIGDQAHQERDSDHNPNAVGVVCAIDVLDDAGLDLAWFAERVRTSGHPALKYVIYRDRIAFRGGDWGEHTGDYHSHVHVSAGTGPDGSSAGPYDDTSSWGLLDDQEDDDMTRDEVQAACEDALVAVLREAADRDGKRGRHTSSNLRTITLAYNIRDLIRAQQPLLEAAAQGQGMTADQVAAVAAAVAEAAGEELADQVADEIGDRMGGGDG